MVFVCGGAFQGKRSWAAKRWKIAKERILDGRELDLDADSRTETKAGADSGPWLFDHLEAYVRRSLEEGGDPFSLVQKLVMAYPDLILVTDEIGSGIIPMDPQERVYREMHGRLCCQLAGQAVEVYRVVCGIGCRIWPQEA